MAEFELKIDASAFQKFLFLRDYKPYEVTVFGLTHKENPLHVYDFQLVKQVVNNVSSDCCKDYMAEFADMNIAKGISPINSERVWCHTHPMKGEGSANPSGKDMATWNAPENELKNFMIMMILSSTGEMTCKLRVRGNYDQLVKGLTNPLVYEKDIKVSVVKDQAYLDKVKAGLVAKFGEQAVEALGDKAITVLSPHIKLMDIFPEFSAVEEEYKKLVLPEVFKPVNHGHYYPQVHNNATKNRKKKAASAEVFPEILMTLSEHKTTLSTLTDVELQKLQAAFDDIDDITCLTEYETLFYADNPQPKKTKIDVLLGAITGGIIDIVGKDQIVVPYKDKDLSKRIAALNSAAMTYPFFKDLASKINTGV